MSYLRRILGREPTGNVYWKLVEKKVREPLPTTVDGSEIQLTC